MYILKAENRSADVKVKEIRKAGMVPGCVYGGKLSETLLIQIPTKEILKLLREKTVGGQVSLAIEKKKISALIKEVSVHPVSGSIDHISFQSLVAGEPVHSTAHIVLENEEKVSDVIKQSLFEIPIKALPDHLVEEVKIDLEGLSAGAVFRLEDLDIARNPDIELLIPHDTMVLHIVEKSAVKSASSEEEQEAAAEEAAEAATPEA